MDIADRAQEREQVNLAQALERRAENAALDQRQPLVIDGRRTCLDCFAPLDQKRLKANPQAVRCVECQQQDEQRHRWHR